MTSIESGVASASSLGWAGVPDVQEALEESGAWHHQTPDHGLLSDDLHKLLEVKHVRGCQKYR